MGGATDTPPISDTWRSDAWRTRATCWIDDRLSAIGLQRSGPIDQRRVRPWSTNIVVPCDGAPRGCVWFKACTDASAYEAALVDELSAHRTDVVAEPWAVDRSCGWLLSPDEGPVFRDVVGADVRLARWAVLLRRYADLQVSVATWSRLRRLGVPEHSPSGLVRAWRERAVGSTDEVRRAGYALERAAERLERSGLPGTLQHDDLHTGNAFVADDGVESVLTARIFDWGDTYIGHPFCSLLIGLRCLSHQYDLDLSPKEEGRLLDAYLVPWSAHEDPEVLRTLVPDAMLIGRIGRVLGWERSMARASAAEHLEWDVHPRTWLAEVTALAAAHAT